MTLKEVCEIADECGLETVGEAVANMQMSFDALPFDAVEKEFAELNKEINDTLGPDWEDVSIYKVISN